MGNIFDIAKTLHPLELRVILNYKEEDSVFALRLSKDLNYNEGQSNKVVEWLLSKGILKETFRKLNVFYRLTEKGVDAFNNGLIEERIVTLVSQKNGFGFQFGIRVKN
ncbi:hypothetical protein Q7M_519 [Borrelia crocidurae str. Achema]|uniref:Uncharacterized protein n=1 Tax=Borrelia crocidurae (strain Achema) TaxID=1155096 RepID=I0FCU2_BORCA|nr:hypothetical protein Q7M_519 [Borrelia crocidurae str. Achema]